jgi:alanine racemase
VQSRIAILNIGYADGLWRRIGPRLDAIADGRRLPLVGRVSMDLVAVDVTAGTVAEGDWLTLDFDLPKIAIVSGVSQYELLVTLGQRLDRRWAG